MKSNTFDFNLHINNDTVENLEILDNESDESLAYISDSFGTLEILELNCWNENKLDEIFSFILDIAFCFNYSKIHYSDFLNCNKAKDFLICHGFKMFGSHFFELCLTEKSKSKN